MHLDPEDEMDDDEIDEAYKQYTRDFDLHEKVKVASITFVYKNGSVIKELMKRADASSLKDRY